MIPVEYRYHPPCVEGEALKGQANRVMLILENMMRSGLDQHMIRFVPYDGAVIVARKIFGRRTVDIYTGKNYQAQKGVTRCAVRRCRKDAHLRITTARWPPFGSKGDGRGGAHRQRPAGRCDHACSAGGPRAGRGAQTPATRGASVRTQLTVCPRGPAPGRPMAASGGGEPVSRHSAQSS